MTTATKTVPSLALLLLLVGLIVEDGCAAAAASETSPPNKPRKMRRRVMADVIASATDRMPSLFRDEEEIYDRYAACLAATEGLRRLRDKDMAETNFPAMTSSKDTSSNDNRHGDKSQAKTRQRIVHSYVHNSGKVLRAMGMSVKQFNDLGREISQNEKLKAKVMEQAYLYRMAATINMDRSRYIHDDEDEEHVFSSHGSHGSKHDAALFRKEKITQFCNSLSEIETLRGNQVERLKKSLHVERFPDNVHNLGDSTLLPFLAPRVRAVVEAFPLQAEAIVQKHGLQSDEFNQMLRATKTNPLFRWKIQKQLRGRDIHNHHNDLTVEPHGTDGRVF